MLKPVVGYSNLGNPVRALFPMLNDTFPGEAARGREAAAAEALARRLRVDEETVSCHRLRFPDGSTFYTPRFRWCLLVKAIVEEFCPRFTPGGDVLYVRDSNETIAHEERHALAELEIAHAAPGKMPDVVVRDQRRKWLVLVEAVTSAGPVDLQRRGELTALFAKSKAGLVYVTAFSTREAMRSFLPDISWGTEVWIASAPDHLIHFNGARLPGPYP